jgi:hypothetical protein
MHRLSVRLLPLAVALLVASGCSGDDTPDTPLEPPPSLVETFTGTLSLNGAASHSFTITAVGTITALLSELTPDTTAVVGLALGTWSGSVCQISLPNDNVVVGQGVQANSTSVGDFCVRIYDAKGTVPRPQTYVVLVEHQ